VLCEHAILTLCVLPLLVQRRAALRGVSPSTWLCVLGIAWGGSAIATLAFTSAFKHGNPTVVVLLQQTQPLWAIGAAALVLGERPRRRFGAFVLPALAGVYLLSFGWTSPSDVVSGGRGRAALLARLAAALWGSATALGRRALGQLPYGVLTGLRFTLALPLLLAIAAYEGAVLPPSSAGAHDAARVVAIALVPGLAALLLYYRGLRSTPASVATLAELAFPASTLVFNRLFLDSSISRWQFAGFAVVWVTIALLHRAPVRLPGGRLLRRPLSEAPDTA
jgi:drug/metabolite transporter (DMT)-like permease